MRAIFSKKTILSVVALLCSVGAGYYIYQITLVDQDTAQTSAYLKSSVSEDDINTVSKPEAKTVSNTQTKDAVKAVIDDINRRAPKTEGCQPDSSSKSDDASTVSPPASNDASKKSDVYVPGC